MLGLDLAVPSLESVTLSGPEGARRVRGANPPRTRPTPVTGSAERGFWRRKKTRAAQTPAVTTAPAPVKPPKPAKPPKPQEPSRPTENAQEDPS